MISRSSNAAHLYRAPISGAFGAFFTTASKSLRATSYAKPGPRFPLVLTLPRLPPSQSGRTGSTTNLSLADFIAIR